MTDKWSGVLPAGTSGYHRAPSGRKASASRCIHLTSDNKRVVFVGFILLSVARYVLSLYVLIKRPVGLLRFNDGTWEQGTLAQCQRVSLLISGL